MSDSDFPVVFGTCLDAEAIWLGKTPENAAKPVLLSHGSFEIHEVPQRKTLAVTAMREFQARLAEFGFELLPLNASQLGAFMKAELSRWEKLIRQSGIEAQ